MRSGITNSEKAHVRQRFYAGEATREELLESELAAYHSAGTCTFYGTANSNQLLMEFMGLHVPGAAFVPHDSGMRDDLTRAATAQLVELTANHGDYRPIAEIVDERVVVNALVGLSATGGSSNHTIHLVAMARAAGININWDDFDALSRGAAAGARLPERQSGHQPIPRGRWRRHHRPRTAGERLFTRRR